MRWSMTSCLAPEWVDEWTAVGVDDRWWAEFDASAVDGDVPALVVHLLVMHRAQQAAIFGGRLAAIGPVRPVVCFAESRWPVTPRKRTSAVPRDECAADA
jgi:hypothetical protein